MSRLFVSEYKNNAKLSESKKNLSSKMRLDLISYFSPCPELDKDSKSIRLDNIKLWILIIYNVENFYEDYYSFLTLKWL